MGTLERFSSIRRKTQETVNADIEKTLFEQPRVSDTTKAGLGGTLMGVGGYLINSGNRALQITGFAAEMAGINTVAVVGKRADTAKRILRRKTRRP